MAVAWIGNREAPVGDAVEAAAQLLTSSRCPVFTLDTDVHGTRAAVALAERVGASYDHVLGAQLANEAALFTDKGAMTVAPGEARRRADLIVMVGDLPAEHLEWVNGLARTAPDLAEGKARAFFAVTNGAAARRKPDGAKATVLSCGDMNLAGVLAAIRAALAGRRISTPVSNFEKFAKALSTANFAVFLCSGLSTDALALEMLQGLIADINKRSRASSLLLPSSDDGWGTVLASTWMTGFPPCTGFGRGMPEYDPWRFDAARMIAAGEADLHMILTDKDEPSFGRKVKTIVIAPVAAPCRGAAVTLSVGRSGIDHDAVRYSSLTGTIVSVAASAPSDAKSAADLVRAIAAKVPAEAAPPC